MSDLAQVDKLDVLMVADWFINQSRLEKQPLTHKKLQKLLYYTKHWSLYGHRADNDVKLPAGMSIDAEFEAWVQGAVCRQVFYKYHGYGFSDLRLEVDEADLRLEKLAEEYKRLLSKVWQAYKQCSANNLERLNHQEEAWVRQILNLSKATISIRKIDEADMRKYKPQVSA